MAWLERMRAAQLAGITALALVVVGCSEDKTTTKPPKGDQNDDDDSDDDDGAEGDTDDDDKEMDAGSKPPVMDANINPPKVDAGDSGAPIVITTPDSGPIKLPDAAAIGPTFLTPLPHDGDKVSICYAESDCNTDDLTCYLPAATGIPGVCVDDCDQDKDCPALDGVKGLCNIVSHQCEYDCNKGGKGEGKCPDDMVCSNQTPQSLFATWRCRYPEGGGKKTEESWAKCDPAHGSGDCEGVSTCGQPKGNFSTLILPHGYCAPLCMKDADCKLPEGVSSKAYCFAGQCQTDCSAPGATCPRGMNCKDVDPAPGAFLNACVYID